MPAGRACLRGFRPLEDVAAVDAVPLHRRLLLEYLLLRHVLDQLPIARLMEFLHPGDLLVGTGRLGKPSALAVLAKFA